MARRCPWWAPPILAVQFLTRLPVPGTAGLHADQVAVGLVRAVGWFPLVGTLIGAITAVAAVGSLNLWPVYVAVALALMVEALVTGAFHEDAVADFCDAFGGGVSSDDVRRIMKDSRIGSYGSLGLILAIALRAALTVTVLTTMPPLVAVAAIIAAATFGRLVVVALMLLISPAPGNAGLARDVASGVGVSTLLFGMTTAVPGLLAFAILCPVRLLAALVVAGLFLTGFRRLLLRRIGGSTGDCLGFVAYAGQLILLLAAATQ